MVIILVMHYMKVIMKSQIIGVYPYMIPHFNTNKLLRVFLLYICYCDYSARIYSNFKGSKVIFCQFVTFDLFQQLSAQVWE